MSDPPALLLDEMFAPLIAAKLRERGFDVVAVAADPDLRAATDEELFDIAAQRGRRIVTENVKDFRRILLRAEESGRASAGLLFSSSRTFPRSRRNPGPLISALEQWLTGGGAADRPLEDWLLPA